MVVPAPLSSNASEPCEALEAYNDNRPPVSNEFIKLHWGFLYAFLAVGVMLIVITQIKYKALERSGRSANVTGVHIVALMCGFAPFTWRLAEFRIGCQLHGFLLIMHVALSFTAYILRALREWNRAEFAHLAVRFDRNLVTNNNDDAKSEQGTVSAHSELDVADKRNAVYKALLILWDLFTTSGQSGNAQHTGKSVENASSISNHDKAEERLRLYSFLDRKYAAGILFLVLFVPGFLALIPLYMTASILNSRGSNGQGCMNCDIFLELWIIITVMGVLYSCVLLRAMWRLRGKPDPYGNAKEIKHVMMICGPLHVFAWVLFAIDPNNVDYDRAFRWTWIQMIAIVIALILVAVVPLIKAVRKPLYRSNSLSSLSSSAMSRETVLGMVGRLDDIIEKPEVAARFEKFAEERFAAESFRFICDVTHWRKMHMSKSNEMIRKKAKIIYERYIAPDALLEVNIDANTKLETKKNLFDETTGELRAVVPVDAFDVALKETKKMVEYGTWFDFLNDEERRLGGMSSAPETVL